VFLFSCCLAIRIIGPYTSSNLLPGNQKYLTYCWNARYAFHLAPPSSKTAVVDLVMRAVFARRPSGRFLKPLHNHQRACADATIEHFRSGYFQFVDATIDQIKTDVFQSLVLGQRVAKLPKNSVPLQPSLPAYMQQPPPEEPCTVPKPDVQEVPSPHTAGVQERAKMDDFPEKQQAQPDGASSIEQQAGSPTYSPRQPAGKEGQQEGPTVQAQLDGGSSISKQAGSPTSPKQPAEKQGPQEGPTELLLAAAQQPQRLDESALIAPNSVDPTIVPGTRLGIFWPLDQAYYYAVVEERVQNFVYLEYDDLAKEWLDLTKHRYKIVSDEDESAEESAGADSEANAGVATTECAGANTERRGSGRVEPTIFASPAEVVVQDGFAGMSAKEIATKIPTAKDSYPTVTKKEVNAKAVDAIKNLLIIPPMPVAGETAMQMPSSKETIGLALPTLPEREEKKSNPVSFQRGSLFIDSLSDFATKEPPSPSTALALEKQRRLEDCLALQNAVPPPVTAATMTRDLLDLVDDDKEPSPAKGNADSSESVPMLPPSVMSNGQDDAVSQEKEEQEQVTLPASMLTAKPIPTPQSLAMLLHPKETISAATYSGYASRWTKAEDEHLKYAVALGAGPPHNWKEIARTYFPATRNGNQVRTTCDLAASRHCLKSSCGLVWTLNPSTSSRSFIHPWYTQQCKQRWKKIDPASNTSEFTAEEDKIILESKQAGLSFAKISNMLLGRSVEKVRQRFLRALDPSRKKSVPWTEQEDGILRLYQGLWGNKWTDIAEKLPGRTENDVKNRWYSLKYQSERKLKAVVETNSSTGSGALVGGSRLIEPIENIAENMENMGDSAATTTSDVPAASTSNRQEDLDAVATHNSTSSGTNPRGFGTIAPVATITENSEPLGKSAVATNTVVAAASAASRENDPTAAPTDNEKGLGALDGAETGLFARLCLEDAHLSNPFGPLSSGECQSVLTLAAKFGPAWNEVVPRDRLEKIKVQDFPGRYAFSILAVKRNVRPCIPTSLAHLICWFVWFCCCADP